MGISSIRQSRRKYPTAGIAIYPIAEAMKTPREQKNTLDFGFRISDPVRKRGIKNQKYIHV